MNFQCSRFSMERLQRSARQENRCGDCRLCLWCCPRQHRQKWWSHIAVWIVKVWRTSFFRTPLNPLIVSFWEIVKGQCLLLDFPVSFRTSNSLIIWQKTKVSSSSWKKKQFALKKNKQKCCYFSVGAFCQYSTSYRQGPHISGGLSRHILHIPPMSQRHHFCHLSISCHQSVLKQLRFEGHSSERSVLVYILQNLTWDSATNSEHCTGEFRSF